MSDDRIAARLRRGGVRLRDRARAAGIRALGGERLLLAAKTAGAATAAWALGHQLPGHLDDYAYYAPFGAVIAMTPTLISSARSTLHTVAGTAVGILLAWALFLLHAPGWVAVPVAAAVGVVVAGLFSPGPARDYVPVAALFVLTVGGADAGDYSMGYLIQVALGMLTALVVSLVIPPPPGVHDAATSAERLRGEVAAVLRAAADATESADDERPEIGAAGRVRAALDTAQDALAWAQESARGNARGFLSRRRLASERRQLIALQRIARRTEELVDLLTPGPAADRGLRDLSDPVRAEAAVAIRFVADAVEHWPDDEEDAAAVRARVDDQLARLAEATRQSDDGDRDRLVGMTLTTLLGRMAAGATTPAE